MMTKEQAPWIDYLEIDEETTERRLSSDAPDEIKKVYENHEKKIQKHIDKGTTIPK